MERQIALNTLTALRGYFRDEAPAIVHGAPQGQAMAEGVLHHCIDSRMLGVVLHLGAAELFDSASAGAAIPVWCGGKGDDLQTAVSFGFPAMNFENVKTFVVSGHTDCGAVRALYNVIISDGGISSQAARWMSQVAPEGLRAALLRARSANVPEVEVLRILEQLVVLQSVRNLYDYKFDEVSVCDLVDNGRLNILACVRCVNINPETGRFPFVVFDPEYKKFRDIFDIYVEAGSPSLTQLESKELYSNMQTMTSRSQIESINNGMQLLLDAMALRA